MCGPFSWGALVVGEKEGRRSREEDWATEKLRNRAQARSGGAETSRGARGRVEARASGGMGLASGVRWKDRMRGRRRRPRSPPLQNSCSSAACEPYQSVRRATPLPRAPLANLCFSVPPPLPHERTRRPRHSADAFSRKPPPALRAPTDPQATSRPPAPLPTLSTLCLVPASAPPRLCGQSIPPRLRLYFPKGSVLVFPWDQPR